MTFEGPFQPKAFYGSVMTVEVLEGELNRG